MPNWACRNLFRPDSLEFKLDVEAFTNSKARWSKDLSESLSMIPIESVLQESKNPEDVLAFVEAVAESEGSDLLRFRELFEKNPKEAEIFMGALTRAIDKGPAFTWTDVRSIARETYRLSNPGMQTGLKRFLPMNMDSAIEARVRFALERETLENAFRKVGFFRDPTGFGKFRQWLENHTYVTELPILAGFNVLSLHYVGSVLPPGRLSFLNWKAVPKEWTELYRKGGLPAVKPLFMKEFGGLARADYAWRVFTTTVTAAAVGVITYYIVTEHEQIIAAAHWVHFGLKMNFADLSPEGLKKYSEENFDCDVERKKRLEGWKESYRAFEGKELTPESDPAEWESLRKQILTVPCDSLRPKF